MKILHFTQWIPKVHESWGGAEVCALRLIKFLEERGVENYIACLPFNGELEKTFQVKRMGFLRKLYLSFFPFDPLSFISSLRILLKVRPDEIYLHNFKEMSLSPLIASKLLGFKVSSFIYDYWFFCPLSMLFTKKWKKCDGKGDCSKCFGIIGKVFWLRKKIFNFFIRKIDRFFTLSQSSSRLLRNHGIGKKKIKLFPAYVFAAKFKKRRGKVIKKTILYVGWLVPHKGLHVLIQALSYVVKKYPNTKLYVIGDMEVNKEYVEYVKELVKKNGLEKNVIFLGRKRFEEVLRYYQKCEVVVIPEQWENMSPMVLIESMYLDKKIVASRIGGIPEILGKEGFLASPENPKDFSRKILTAFKVKRKRPGERILKLMKQKKNVLEMLMGRDS